MLTIYLFINKKPYYDSQDLGCTWYRCHLHLLHSLMPFISHLHFQPARMIYIDNANSTNSCISKLIIVHMQPYKVLLANVFWHHSFSTLRQNGASKCVLHQHLVWLHLVLFITYQWFIASTTGTLYSGCRELAWELFGAQ